MSGKSNRIEVMDDAMAEVLREKSGRERLAISWRMWSSARDMLRTHLREIHPDWTAAEIQRETARRMSHGAV
jgi:hypothetical protein